MGILAKLGFDEAYDRTIGRQRARVTQRLGVAAPLAVAVSLILGVAPTLAWAGLLLTGELWLWIMTSERAYRTRPVTARTLRLLASSMTSFAWVLLVALLWREGSEAARLMGAALLAGAALYVQRTWDDMPIQVIASTFWFAVALAAAPLALKADLPHRLALAAGILMFVGFTVTAMRAGYKRAKRLASANAELVREREAAEAANQAKTAFLANMSHEIRTPLNGVIGAVDVLAASRLEPRQREMVEMVRASGEMLERLLSDVLDLARVEAGKVTLEAADFDLGGAVRGAAALIELRARDKGLDFVIDVAPEAGTAVRGDGVRLKQILTNLISNAVKFTAKGEVRVTVRRADGVATVVVQDTGVGFDPSDKDLVFGRFQQADGSITRRFGGSGLGLAISRELAELMGGTLDCDSRPGSGSRFVLTLPLPDAQGAKVLSAPAVAATPGPDGLDEAQELCVLLADDHPTNRKVVQLMLDRPGLKLVEAETGRQALDAYKAGRFDLVLMDMQMPEMDGLAATQALRAHEAAEGLARTPVIMLTANALPEHVAAAHACGADHHLAKPITAATLFRAIAEALSADTQTPSSRPEARGSGR